MAKRIFLYLTALVCLISGMTAAAGEVRQLCCTTYPVWLFTREIARNVPDRPVTLLIPSGSGCPHDYVLTPQDLAKLGKQDQIVICNGLGMDDFVPNILKKINPKCPVIASTAPDPTKNLIKDPSGNWNSHWFASPESAVWMVQNIVHGLSYHDAEHAVTYQKNGEKLIQRLQTLAKRFARLKQEPMQSVVVQHSIFAYLARLAGFRVILLAESDDAPALSALQLQKLLREVNRLRAQSIWADLHSPQQPIEALRKECKLPVISLDLLSGGPQDPDMDYYFQCMEQNLKLLQQQTKR